MTKAGNSQITRTIILLITIFSLSLPVHPSQQLCYGEWTEAKYSGGTGEPNDPYQIATAEDLMLLGESPEDYDKHFILTADIDLDPNLPGGKVFDSAVIAPDVNDGNYYESGIAIFDGTPFTGVFDGNSHTISNLMIRGNDYLALFGLVGANGFPGTNAIIINLNLVDVDVNGVGSKVGSIAGDNRDDIIACSSTGIVMGLSSVGGLVGENHDFGFCSITTSHSRVTVTGTENVGGLVGYNGRLVSQCYSTGPINGSTYVGGLVGKASQGPGSSGSRVINCYSTSTVSGVQYVGGLVGFNGCGIYKSYSTGHVCETEPTDGIVTIGGLVGRNSEWYGWVGQSFWDTQTSTQATCNGMSVDCVGKNTAEMQTASTFLEAGWDFVDEIENGTDDVWKIVEGLTYPLLSWQKYGGGTGDPNDPYLIYTAEHLNKLGADPNDYDKCFKLMADIDLLGYSYHRALIAPDTNDIEYWFQGTPFSGIFDGNDHIISHLTISGEDFLGLFGYLDYRARIYGLGIEAVDVNGLHYVGGLVGLSEGFITASYSTGTVKGCTDVGGLVGHKSVGYILFSHSSGTVTGDSHVGGLVGEAYGDGFIMGTHSNSIVTGNDTIGGLVGYNTVDVTQCYSAGQVIGKNKVGGLVGINLSDSLLAVRYEGTIINSYSMSLVDGESEVGGLVGRNENIIVSCYSVGKVSGNENTGGLVGYKGGGFRIPEGSSTASYWDLLTTGQSSSDGGTGKTTTEMQTAATFLEAGWDFVDEIENGTEGIWWILEGQDYPRLWWQLSEDNQ